MKSHAREIMESILRDGESAIDAFISDREAESLFLDFKRSADNGSGKKLHQNDRANLAKAISGFGNSEGGILVWGVDCREGEDYADVACAKFPLSDAKKFLSWIEGAVSSATIPPHSGIENHAILSKGGREGFLITYIPKSNHAPHQVVVSGKGQYHYYIRAGSDFLPTPHSVLSGMFGRSPQPFIFQMFTSQYPTVSGSSDPCIKTTLGVQIANGGLGIASDLFMSLKFLAKPGKNCSFSIQTPDPSSWTVWSFLGVHYTSISKDHIHLPPDAQLQPYVITLTLQPPFDGKLMIEGLCGCGQSPSFNFTLENSASNIEKMYNAFLVSQRRGTLPDWSTVHDEFDFWNIAEKSKQAREAYK
ncbi:MAG: ATP-binding protein [Syntrophales bacterium]|nr:ATP-binding protein [Syntrophales bacterium]